MHSNHRANDPSCPSRSEYLGIRERIGTGNRGISRNQNHHQTSVGQSTFNQSKQQNSNRGIQSQNFHFNRSSQRSTSIQNQSKNLNANAPEFSYNVDHFPSLPGNQPNFAKLPSNSYANVSKNQLLSADEFFDVFNDALTKFYQCKTAADQFALIASLLRHAIR